MARTQRGSVSGTSETGLYHASIAPPFCLYFGDLTMMSGGPPNFDA